MRDIESRTDEPQVEPSDETSRTSQTAASSTTKTVEIKIALPDLTPITDHPAYYAARDRTSKLRSNKFVLGGIILAVAASVAINFLFPNQDNAIADKDTTQGLTRGTPEYATVLPTGKTIRDLGGWTRVSPSDKDPVFAYIDKIGTTKIIVSQQPLPDAFKEDKAEKILALAKQYNATEKITVDGELVHIGTSEKGPQSLILSRDDLLILIKSSLQIDSNEWAKYINSLR